MARHYIFIARLSSPLSPLPFAQRTGGPGRWAFDQVEPSHARLGPYWESSCRAWLGTTSSSLRLSSPLSPLPFAQRRGGLGRGAFEQVEPSHARLGPYWESFCRAWLGTTSSSLRLSNPLSPLPFAQRRGGLGRGAFDLVEPSHARLGPYWESLCRAWLGTTSSSLA